MLRREHVLQRLALDQALLSLEEPSQDNALLAAVVARAQDRAHFLVGSRACRRLPNY